MRITIKAATIAVMFFLAVACTKPEPARPVLTEQTAIDTLKSINPELEFLSVNKTAMDGIWEVVFKSGMNISITYMSHDGSHLFAGNILDVKKQLNVTDERIKELKRIDPAALPTKGTILLGSAAASIVVYVFSDPDCEYCGLLHGEMVDAVKKNADVAFQIVLVPMVEKNPESLGKSMTIMCAETNEDSLELLGMAFEGKKLPTPECDLDLIAGNLEYLEKFNISGTPTIFFPDGSRYEGAIQSDRLIAEALAAAKSKAEKTPNK